MRTGRGIATNSEFCLRPETPSCLSTGMESLDLLLRGGVPRGQITEVIGPAGSGKTGVLLSILAQATRRDEMVAYVDAFDSLDPQFAEKAGVTLSQLLWVRCHTPEQALKAADILARGGGLGVLALDLTAPFKCGIRIPSSCWLRLRRAIEGTATVLLVLEAEATAGSTASVVIALRRSQSQWCFPRLPAPIAKDPRPGAGKEEVRACLFRGIQIQAQLLRGRSHGSTTFYSHLHH